MQIVYKDTGMSGKRTIRFENAFAKQLYMEISGIQNMKSIDRPYITQEYIWAVWQRVYKNSFGCTSYILRDFDVR